ncbi:MAG: CRISPR-associated endonuclease Cas1 [Armatimonadota bacterium]
MGILYVTTPGSVVRISHDTVRVTRGSRTLAELPSLSVDSILLFGNCQITTPMVHYCAEHNIELFFLSGYGRFIGKLNTGTSTNLPVRMAQMQAAQNDRFALRLARGVVRAKLHNCRGYARRLLRDGVVSREHNQVADELSRMVRRAERCADLESLRGIEGTGARAYFSLLRDAIGDQIGMGKRSRRPPEDPGNALLSLAYSLLFTQVYAAVECAGLDPYLGFYHADKWGRPALVLDLMEEFRPVIADRLVVGLVRRRMISADDFVEADDLACGLTRDAFSLFCRQFAGAMARRLKHPDSGESTTYRRCLEIQARRLARVLRGEAQTYQPFELER